MATIRDVARLAGVGLGTASRAISGKGVVSAETLLKVEGAVRQLNFRPSKVARSLSSKSQSLVGVYFPTFEGTYFAPILQTIETELRSQGLHMVTATLSGSGPGTRRERSLKSIEFLIERQCDGILLIDNYTDESDLKALKSRINHLALVNRTVRGMAQDSFSINHEDAGRLAAQALIERGHRQFAVMYSARHSPDVDARMRGFQLELQAQRLQPPREFLLDGLMTFAHAWEAAGTVAKLKKRDFSAIFCANDVLAMATLGRLQSAGVRVPQDVSVLGYDDAEIAAYTYPSISTVRVPSKWIAINACRHLLNRAFGLALPVKRRFAPEMVWRDSVKDLGQVPV
jgi:LacI family transcriptional regulator